MYSFLCGRARAGTCGAVPSRAVPGTRAHLGGAAERPQGDDDGELLGEAIAVDEEPRGGEGQGSGPRCRELQSSQPLHLQDPHAPGQRPGRHRLRQHVQRAQVCARDSPGGYPEVGWGTRRWQSSRMGWRAAGACQSFPGACPEPPVQGQRDLPCRHRAGISIATAGAATVQNRVTDAAPSADTGAGTCQPGTPSGSPSPSRQGWEELFSG